MVFWEFVSWLRFRAFGLKPACAVRALAAAAQLAFMVRRAVVAGDFRARCDGAEGHDADRTGQYLQFRIGLATVVQQPQTGRGHLGYETTGFEFHGVDLVASGFMAGNQCAANHADVFALIQAEARKHAEAVDRAGCGAVTGAQSSGPV